MQRANPPVVAPVYPQSTAHNAQEHSHRAPAAGPSARNESIPVCTLPGSNQLAGEISRTRSPDCNAAGRTAGFRTVDGALIPAGTPLAQ